MTSTIRKPAAGRRATAAGPVVLMTALEPTNRPAPMTPPSEIIVMCRDFSDFCSSGLSSSAMPDAYPDGGRASPPPGAARLRGSRARGEVVVGDRQRRQQPDDVAVQAARRAAAGPRSRAAAIVAATSSGAGVFVSRSRTSSSASIGPSPRTSPIASTSAAMSSSALAQPCAERLGSARGMPAGDRVEHDVRRRAGRPGCRRTCRRARPDRPRP